MAEKNTINTKEKLGTKFEITWCPGCPNFMILESVKKAFAKLIDEGFAKQEDFAIVTGIGCHAKIFDYINVGGFYGLHGRVMPTALGIKLGNPNMTVVGFEGDGDAYAEGMEHFIHAGRYNSNMTLLVHDNQAFALTTGQSTPTSQQGYMSKSTPFGEKNIPLNPIKLALASGATFIARTYALNLEHCAKTIEKAIKHKGFSFVEIIQPCLQFNKEMDEIRKSTYEILDNSENMEQAMKIADEWDYNTKAGKIPIGVIYQTEKPSLEEKWSQLVGLMEKKVGWKDFKK
jgi:2-oxoglutarate/2-oxoacid ferredoxin oxidoreductase subunit beta